MRVFLSLHAVIGDINIKQQHPKIITAWTYFLRSLLFWAHLSHVDSHTDDLSCLHPHRTGGLPVPAGRGVESRDGRILYALSPWAGLPMIHSARVFVTAARFL